MNINLFKRDTAYGLVRCALLADMVKRELMEARERAKFAPLCHHGQLQWMTKHHFNVKITIDEIQALTADARAFFNECVRPLLKVHDDYAEFLTEDAGDGRKDKEAV